MYIGIILCSQSGSFDAGIPPAPRGADVRQPHPAPESRAASGARAEGKTTLRRLKYVDLRTFDAHTPNGKESSIRGIKTLALARSVLFAVLHLVQLDFQRKCIPAIR